MLVKNTISSKNTELIFWLNRFEKELLTFVHHKNLLEHSFKINFLNNIVPNFFPHVFFKAPFVYNNELTCLAHEILPKLYLSIINDPENFSNLISKNINYNKSFQALLNYFIWKGLINNLCNLANIFEKFEISNEQVFELTALYLGTQKKLPFAKVYRSKISNPSPFFLLFFHNIEFGVEKKYSSKNIFNQNIYYDYVYYKQNQDLENIKQILNIFSNREFIDFDNLLFDYNTLISSGYLFRANRLLLKFIRENNEIEKSFILDIVLQSYLQNQKYFAYLKRLIKSSLWANQRNWYEQEFCIRVLNLEHDKKSIWDKICQYKKNKVTKPIDKNRNDFYKLLSKSSVDTPTFPSNILYEFEDIILSRYMQVNVSTKNSLNRRYGIFKKYILNPCTNLKNLDPEKIVNLTPYMFWTIFFYIENPNLKTYINYLEALCSSNLIIRALLALYYYRKAAIDSSEVLFKNLTFCHPLFQSKNIALLLQKNKWISAFRIARRIQKLFPFDKTIYNYYNWLEKIYSAKPNK